MPLLPCANTVSTVYAVAEKAADMCHHNVLAYTLQRQPPELRYCFLCFSWFVEEKWEEHCESHVKSFASEQCGSIIYCGTLVCLSFYPFYIGKEDLDVASRLGLGRPNCATILNHIYEELFGRTSALFLCAICSLKSRLRFFIT